MIPLRDSNPSGTRPVVTVALIAVSALVFLFELSLGKGIDLFVIEYGLIPGVVTGAYRIPGFGPLDIGLRFVTSMFLHGGWMHLIGNMWYLWIFGDNIEDRLGHAGFALFYVACGIGAGAMHVATNAASPVPTVGASGAIAGVLGAYIMCFPKARVTTFIPFFFVPYVVRLPAVVVLGMWFLTQLMNGSVAISAAARATGGVAWWAHIGGFVIGAALIRVLPARKRRRQQAYRPRFDRRRI